MILGSHCGYGATPTWDRRAEGANGDQFHVARTQFASKILTPGVGKENGTALLTAFWYRLNTSQMPKQRNRVIKYNTSFPDASGEPSSHKLIVLKGCKMADIRNTIVEEHKARVFIFQLRQNGNCSCLGAVSLITMVQTYWVCNHYYCIQ